MPDPALVIVIPAYNAALTLEGVFDRIPRKIAERTAHVVVVNDGSTDATSDVARRLQARFPNLALIEHPVNRGYGSAAKTGLARSLELGAGLIVWLHADGQYAPESIPELLAPLERNEADIVQGSRMKGGGALRGGMPLYKFVANKALTWLENRIFGSQLAEYHSGYLLYRREALEAIPFQQFTGRSFIFDQEMIVGAQILGLRVIDLPIPTRYTGEKSHLKPIPYGIDVLKLLGRYLRGDYHRLVKQAHTAGL
jgi:glycosyltransferase involved in cell wall biosynthesis